MKYFVLILAFGFLGFFLLGTNASYSQTDSFDGMNYSQFLDFCHRYNPALWDSIPIEERLLSNLCDFVGKGFGEKQWNWLNGAKLDWESFAKNASENYADKIPEFTDGGIKETLRVDSFVSGRDSFPPPMTAMISFDYEKLSQVIHYDEKFTICIDGKLVPQDSFIECSDEYVKYNFTKEEPSIIPKFVKPIPLPEHTRQHMLDWCQNSPKWANIDKQFWDVVPTRILSTIPEFESLKGQTNSVEIHSYASEDNCPPNVWMAGTFISENGYKHKFSLHHDGDFFRYNIDEIQCKNGLVLVTKSIDSSLVCVTPETKQKLVERGWAKSDTTKTTFDNYKIDCNNQTNPYQEYECFKEAFSNCIPAIVNPEIYTVEGDPIYTTLNITSDCKIKGTADMSTDRFWGTPETITTQCEKIIDDQYMWAVQNCDSEKLPEMQFNFEMQLYPQILACEENGNTWDQQTLSCVTENKITAESKWRKYITVSASRNDDPEFADALPVYKAEGYPDDPLLNELLVGADGCKNETELCKMPSGVSVVRTYPFLPSGRFIPDNVKYTVTLDTTQAEDVLSLLSWQRYDDSFYTVVQWDNKQYFLVLSSFDHTKTPDVKMDIIDSSPDPIHVSKGDVLNYTLRVNTWATYGAPAQIDFRATQSAKDSGIDVWVKPASLTVPERSNATTTLFIQPQKDAKDGIYSMRVVGDANGKSAGLHCGNTTCPTVMVGDSDWSIRTFGTSSGMGIGTGNSPDGTWAEINLNKNEFFEGDVAEISAFIVNNSTRPIVVEDPRDLLIKVIRADSKGYYAHFYGIHAMYESDKPIVLEPKSKTLLARTFYWNQTTFHDFEDEQRLEPSRRMITMDFSAGNYGWSAHTWVEIK